MRTLDHVPVLLLGRRGDILAHNPLLTAVLGSALNPGSSFVRFLFQDPIARERIINWPAFASASVAALRRELGRRPHDRHLLALTDELRRTDPDVARWWDDHAVRDYASVTKRIQHPTAGPLNFDIEIVYAPHEPDQHLVIYTTEPNTPTALVLPLLTSWDTQPPITTEHHPHQRR